MKKVLMCIFLVVALFLVLCGVYYLSHGSLEMFPTDEQMEKARIAGILMIILGIANGIAGIVISKNKRPEME